MTRFLLRHGATLDSGIQARRARAAVLVERNSVGAVLAGIDAERQTVEDWCRLFMRGNAETYNRGPMLNFLSDVRAAGGTVKLFLWEPAGTSACCGSCANKVVPCRGLVRSVHGWPGRASLIAWSATCWSASSPGRRDTLPTAGAGRGPRKPPCARRILRRCPAASSSSCSLSGSRSATGGGTESPPPGTEIATTARGTSSTRAWF